MAKNSSKIMSLLHPLSFVPCSLSSSSPIFRSSHPILFVFSGRKKRFVNALNLSVSFFPFRAFFSFSFVFIITHHFCLSSLCAFAMFLGREKRSVKTRWSLCRLPPILTFALQRFSFGFDEEEKEVRRGGHRRDRREENQEERQEAF